MTCEGNRSNGPDNPTRRGWVHFGIAAGILAATTVGWGLTIDLLHLVTEKEPVPWPEGVEVDNQTFRWWNMPERIGDRFVLAEDGELTEGGKKDGVPDGELILDDYTKEILGLGSSRDRKRFSDRRSNWHVVRVYRDNRRPRLDPLRYWRLEVCYYTGRLDAVPHVPERCLKADGATVLGSQNVKFNVPTARSPWDEPLQFRRVDVERTNKLGSSRQIAVYYIFSLNGRAESSWEKVRLTLSYPWERHCYFAKIQFSPVGPVTNMAEFDRAAEDFMNYFLPVVLKALPMPSDMEKLKSAGKAVSQPDRAGD